MTHESTGQSSLSGFRKCQPRTLLIQGKHYAINQIQSDTGIYSLRVFQCQMIP